MALQLDLDGLRAFLAVVEHGGFTAAAEHVGRTQSAVSLKIRKLEEALGKPVFVRNAHRTALTPAGELLLGYARRLVEESEAALAHVRAPDAVGTIRLGLGELFLPDHLPRVLVQFRRHHPRVKLDVRVGLSADLLRDWRAGSLDLVVANREGDEKGGRVVATEPLRWIAAKDYDPPRDGVVPLVALPAHCVYRQIAIDALRGIGRTGDVIYTCTSLAGAEAALAAGAGVAVLGRSSLHRNRGLRDVSNALSKLPDYEIAIFGERPDTTTVEAALVRMIEDSLAET